MKKTKAQQAKLAAALARSSEEIGLQQQINEGKSDGCISDGTLNADLSTPIGSDQDGPRMTGIANFGGKKAAPFGSKKRRKAARGAAKAVARKARGPQLSTDGSGDIELGKFGSKWKHGYIPLNPAAAALKAHKKPGGGRSGGGKSKAAENVAGMSNASLHNIQHDPAWNAAHRKAARAELERRGVTPAPHPSSSPDRHDRTPSLTDALNAEREKDAARERARKGSRSPKPSALLSRGEEHALRARRDKLAAQNTIDKRAVRNSNLDAGAHPAEAEIKARNKELGQINRRLKAHYAERDANQRASGGTRNGARRAFDEAAVARGGNADAIARLRASSDANAEKHGLSYRRGDTVHLTSLSGSHAGTGTVHAISADGMVHYTQDDGKGIKIADKSFVHGSRADAEKAAAEKSAEYEALKLKQGREIAPGVFEHTPEGRARLAAQRESVTPMSANTVHKLTGMSPTELKREVARQTALGKKTHAANVERQKSEAAVIAKSPLKRHIERAPGLGEPQSIRKAAMLHAAGNHSAAIEELEQQKAFNARGGLDTRNLSSAIRTLKEENAKKAAENPFDRSKVQPHTNASPASEAARAERLAKREAAQARADRDYEAPEATGSFRIAGGASAKPGDFVSIKGQSNSKVKVVEYNKTMQQVKVQNSFQSGAQGTWIDVRKLVPYGAGTGPESPMPGRMKPGTAVPYRPRSSSRSFTRPAASTVDLAKLTAKKRKKLKPSQFALNGTDYPINDANHARNALTRVAQNGSPREQAIVKAAVRRKFPKIKVS